MTVDHVAMSALDLERARQKLILDDETFKAAIGEIARAEIYQHEK